MNTRFVYCVVLLTLASKNEKKQKRGKHAYIPCEHMVYSYL